MVAAKWIIMPGTGVTMGVRNAAIAFSLGTVVSHWLPAVQALWMYLAWAGVGLAVVRQARLPAAALLGLAWGAVNGIDALDRRIEPGCMATSVVGRIAGLPTEVHEQGLRSRRFVVVPEASECDLRGALRLTWLDGPRVGGGERWSLEVRLKSPRASANAHGFDADAWFVRDKLAATGYVVRGSRFDEPGAGTRAGAAGELDAIRQGLRDRLERLPLVHGGVLAALTLGDKGAIPRDKIDLYRRTGTMHLLVISGLHVGIVTAFGFLAGRGVGLLAMLPPRVTGVATALALAAAYVLLAGAGLSLIRAFAMSLAGMVAVLWGRSSSPSSAFAYALAVVLLIDPMAPLSAGFWLSFGAVAVLLGFFVPRPRLRSWLISAVVAQLAIAAVFAPATTGITGLIHPLSIGVNLVAVPTVTILVVPLALTGVALIGTPAGPWLLNAADFGVQLLEVVLTTADRIPPLYLTDQGGWLACIVAIAAAGLLPTSRLAKGLLASTLAVILLSPRAMVPVGEMDITVLDVGQGTGVLVETASHTLVYDTGPIYPSGRDTGSSVVLPAVRGRGWGRIDTLILSHADVDHIGGAASVLAGFKVGRVLAGEDVPGIDTERCRAGMSWRWDGVAFSFLGPGPRQHLEGNNASCVLLIETASQRALLPGDIEAVVEDRLEFPPVDLLVVPHHGSATSSTPGFVLATRPRFAIVGAGFDNRFGHPHPHVVERYRNIGTHVVSTAEAGAVRWRSTDADAVAVERCKASPYWRRDRSRPSATAVRCRWQAAAGGIELWQEGRTL